MATTIRLSPAALFSLGNFGHRVNDVISSALPPGHAVRCTELHEAFAARPGAVVAALWRADHLVCEQADGLAYEYGVPWLPVVLDSSVLRVGPLVMPGRGPCFRCFDHRSVQHDGKWESTNVVRAAYERDPHAGPAGFLPQHARLAAGLAMRFLASGGATFEDVVTVRLREMVFSRDRVVAVHACTRCGAGAERQRARVTSGLAGLLPLRRSAVGHG